MTDSNKNITRKFDLNAKKVELKFDFDSSRETKCQVKWHGKGMRIGKNSSKVRDKWQRKVLGMPIYAAFGSQLFLLPRIYVPYGNIVFHGVL